MLKSLVGNLKQLENVNTVVRLSVDDIAATAEITFSNKTSKICHDGAHSEQNIISVGLLYRFTIYRLKV